MAATAKFKECKESYEPGATLAHGDVVTLTFELDSDDAAEMVMYLGAIEKGMFGDKKNNKSREVGKANYPEQKEITFEIDRTYPKGNYYLYIEEKKKKKTVKEAAKFNLNDPPPLIEITSPKDLNSEYIHGKTFDLDFTVAGARTGGEETDPDDTARDIGVYLGTKSNPCATELCTKKWPADKETFSWMLPRSVSQGEYFFHLVDKKDSTCFTDSTAFAVPTPVKIAIEVTQQPEPNAIQTDTQSMKVKVMGVIEKCELDVYLQWSERVVNPAALQQKITTEGYMYTRILVPAAETECEFKWTAPRDILAGEYTFKFELMYDKGSMISSDKGTTVKTVPFTVASPYETALKSSHKHFGADSILAPSGDELKDIAICSILSRIVQKDTFTTDVSSLFARPGYGEEKAEDYPDIPGINMLQWTVQLADASKFTVELLSGSTEGAPDKADDLAFFPQWGIFLVHETKTVVLAFRNDSWNPKSKAAFKTASPDDASELEGALFPESIYQAVASHMDMILDGVEDVLETLGDGYTVQITGHSLGGSVASVFAFLALGDKGNEEPGGILMEKDFKVHTFGAAPVACKPYTPPPAAEKKTEKKEGADAAAAEEAEEKAAMALDEAWENGSLHEALGGFDEFTAKHFINVVNEYDVVPRAYGNEVADHKFNSMQWPKAFAKLKESAIKLELPWFESALKAGPLLHAFDSVGTYLALSSVSDISFAAPADDDDGEDADADAAAAALAEIDAASALWRIAPVASDWKAAYLRLDMRQSSDPKLIKKYHALSSYAQNIGTALLGLIKTAVKVEVGKIETQSGGVALKEAEVKKKEVPWPLEEDQTFTVSWKKEMFRPGAAIAIKLRGKSSATAAWQTASVAKDESVEFSSEDLVVGLPQGEYVVEVVQGGGVNGIKVVTQPFYVTVNKTRAAAMKKAAADK